MTNTAVGAKVHQSLDTHRYFASQIAFDGVLADLGPEPLQHILSKITDFLGG